MIRSTVFYYAKILYRSMSIIFLLFTNIIIFASAGKIIFTMSGKQYGHEIFPNFFDGISNLLIVQMGWNFPDIIFPYYIHDKFVLLFFVVFLCINNFILVNIVVGIVYINCKDVLAEQT